MANTDDTLALAVKISPGLIRTRLSNCAVGGDWQQVAGPGTLSLVGQQVAAVAAEAVFGATGGKIVALMLIVFVLQNRKTVAQWLRGHDELEGSTFERSA